MNIRSLSPWLVALASFLLFQSVAIKADEALPGHGPMMGHPGYGHHPQDMLQQVEKRLSELKANLHLSESQKAAWDTWSAGVINDTKARQEKMKAMWDSMKESWEHRDDKQMSAPERMSQGIASEETHLASFQEELSRQKDALARTKTFYSALDEKQKSIFDLFQQKIAHHYGAGHGYGPAHGYGHGPEHCGPMPAGN